MKPKSSVMNLPRCGNRGLLDCFRPYFLKTSDERSEEIHRAMQVDTDLTMKIAWLPFWSMYIKSQA